MSQTIEIPIGISDYLRQSTGNPAITTKNVYYEEDPTNQENQVSLIRRPGIKELMTVGSGPIRKLFQRPDAFNNDLFVASGTEFYRVARTGDASFTATKIPGTLSSSGPVQITASEPIVFITDSVNLFYSDGSSSLTEIVTPDDVPIYRLGYIAGYIICTVMNSQRFYWIKPGEITIDPLDFAEAEGLPEDILDMVILGDQIYFFGKETVEIWYLADDPTAPFQRIQGKLLNVGAVENTACSIIGNDTFMFIASDGTVRIGPSLQRVSTSGIEERIRRAISNRNLASI